MATLGRLMVTVGADISEMERGLQTARDRISGFGDAATRAGGMLTAGLTAPILGLAATAIAAGTKMNEGLANIASLGVSEERVLQMKGLIQDLAIATGKSTTDMADGMYEVISAFGDTGDSMNILEVAARTGAAGLSTTKEAIKVLSAVTQGYGDTSLDAVKKTSDLLFMTVNLGQTTFPELAAAIGNVVPLANLLGVSQEELFAQMATIAGVTGSTSEATTQLRAAYAALLTPTKDMAGAIAISADELDRQGKLAGGPLVDQWKASRDEAVELASALMLMKKQLKELEGAAKPNVKVIKTMKDIIKEQTKATDEAAEAADNLAAGLGPTLVASIGLNDAFIMLEKTTGGNLDKLGTMYGSVEALGAVANLTGKQAETFATKLAAMGNVAGATDKAFAAQTQGINKLGFTWAQLQVKIEVAQQKISEGLAPAMSRVMDILQPFVDRILALADAFAEADEPTQIMIVTIAGIAAAIGPALLAVGAMAQGLAFLLSPIGLIIAGVALLTIAWVQNWGGIQEKTAAVWAVIEPYLISLKDWILSKLPSSLEEWKTLWATTWETIKTKTKDAYDYLVTQFGILRNWYGERFPTTLEGFKTLWATTWQNAKDKFSIYWGIIESYWIGLNAWLESRFPKSMDFFSLSWSDKWQFVKNKVKDAYDYLVNRFGDLRNWYAERFPTTLEGFKTKWGETWGNVQERFTAAWTVIEPYIKQLFEWVEKNKDMIIKIVIAAAGFLIFRMVASVIEMAIAPFARLADAISSFLLLFVNVILAIKAFASVVAFLLSPVGLLIVGITLLALAFGYLFYYDIGGFRTKTVAAFEALQKAAKAAYDILAPFFIPALDRIKEAAKTLGERMEPLGAKFDALGRALQPLAVGLGLIGGLIAGAIGVTAITALNLLASALENLPTIVGAMLDNMILTIETINKVVATMIAAVKLAISGDWAGAWQEAKKIVAIYWLYMVETFNNLVVILGAIWEMIRDTIVNTFKQIANTLGVDLAALELTWTASWTAINDKLTEWKKKAEEVVNYLKNGFKQAWDDFVSWFNGLKLGNPFEKLSEWLSETVKKLSDLLSSLKDVADWIGGGDTPADPKKTGNSTKRMPGIGGGLIGAGVGSSMITVNVTVSDPKDKNEWRKIAHMVADEFERARRT